MTGIGLNGRNTQESLKILLGMWNWEMAHEKEQMGPLAEQPKETARLGTCLAYY